MSALPENRNRFLEFWHEEFMPLLAQEHGLRETTATHSAEEISGADDVAR